MFRHMPSVYCSGSSQPGGNTSGQRPGPSFFEKSIEIAARSDVETVDGRRHGPARDVQRRVQNRRLVHVDLIARGRRSAATGIGIGDGTGATMTGAGVTSERTDDQPLRCPGSVALTRQ